MARTVLDAFRDLDRMVTGAERELGKIRGQLDEVAAQFGFTKIPVTETAELPRTPYYGGDSQIYPSFTPASPEE